MWKGDILKADMTYRDPGVRMVYEIAGTFRELDRIMGRRFGRKPGIRTKSRKWEKVPRDCLQRIQELWGIHPAVLRPDLFVDGKMKPKKHPRHGGNVLRMGRKAGY